MAELTKKVKSAINSVYKEILAMDDRKFQNEIKKHRGGEIASLLIESGMLDCGELIREYSWSSKNLFWSDSESISIFWDRILDKPQNIKMNITFDKDEKYEFLMQSQSPRNVKQFPFNNLETSDDYCPYDLAA